MKTCPLGHTCDSCLWHVHLQGHNPQTGLPVDKRECAIAVLPMLMVQVGGKTDQVAATIESTRNALAAGSSEIAFAISHHNGNNGQKVIADGD